MIRVSKSATIPASLLADNCSKYDGHDVQTTLVADQYEKCYLCEQKTTKSFQIEHLKAQVAFPALKYVWLNLFLACAYCNGRKPNDFDLLDPSTNNIEEIITHRVNLETKVAAFSNLATHYQSDYSVRMLDKIFNGSNGLRDTKGRMLYKDLEREIVFFLEILNDYKTSNNPENKQKVIDSLLITKEFLAFKYWIIKDNNFFEDFKSYMVWNRK